MRQVLAVLVSMVLLMAVPLAAFAQEQRSVGSWVRSDGLGPWKQLDKSTLIDWRCSVMAGRLDRAYLDCSVLAGEVRGLSDLPTRSTVRRETFVQGQGVSAPVVKPPSNGNGGESD